MGGAGRWWRVVIVLAVSVLLASGCDGGSDGAATPPPVTESSTTVGPTDPTRPGGPVEPTLPAAAEGSSPRAAKAFVRYYVDLLNYAMVTGETASFELSSTPGCAGCDDYIDAISDIHDGGGFYRTAGWTLRQILLSAKPPAGVLLSVVAKSARVTFKKSATAEVQHANPQRFTFSLEVTNGEGRWRVSNFFPE